LLQFQWLKAEGQETENTACIFFYKYAKERGVLMAQSLLKSLPLNTITLAALEFWTGNIQPIAGIILPPSLNPSCKGRLISIFNYKRKRNVGTSVSLPVVGHEIVGRKRVGAERSETLNF
jgi:hypothetical protein